MSQPQQLAAGSPDAREGLLAAVQSLAGMRKLMKSLISGYLGSVGDGALIGTVAKLVAKSREQPFGYRLADGVDPAAKTPKPSGPLILHSAWEQVTF